MLEDSLHQLISYGEVHFLALFTQRHKLSILRFIMTGRLRFRKFALRGSSLYVEKFSKLG